MRSLFFFFFFFRNENYTSSNVQIVTYTECYIHKFDPAFGIKSNMRSQSEHCTYCTYLDSTLYTVRCSAATSERAVEENWRKPLLVSRSPGGAPGSWVVTRAWSFCIALCKLAIFRLLALQGLQVQQSPCRLPQWLNIVKLYCKAVHHMWKDGNLSMIKILWTISSRVWPSFSQEYYTTTIITTGWESEY